MVRLALASKPTGTGTSGDESNKPIAVMPLFKDGRIVALHVFGSPFDLSKGDFGIRNNDERTKGAIPGERESRSFSATYTTSADGRQCWKTGFFNRKVTLPTGVAILDLPSTHQVFIVIDDNPEGINNGWLFFNSGDAPHYRNVTKPIIGILEKIHFTEQLVSVTSALTPKAG